MHLLLILKISTAVTLRTTLKILITFRHVGLQMHGPNFTHGTGYTSQSWWILIWTCQKPRISNHTNYLNSQVSQFVCGLQEKHVSRPNEWHMQKLSSKFLSRSWSKICTWCSPRASVSRIEAAAKGQLTHTSLIINSVKQLHVPYASQFFFLNTFENFDPISKKVKTVQQKVYKELSF